MPNRKIKFYPVSEKFNPWAVYECPDLSQHAKSIFTVFHLNPSRIVPTNEEMKLYSGIKTTGWLRAAIKELEIRGVIVFPEGNGRELIVRDQVNPKPAAEIMPLPPPEQPPQVENKEVEQLQVFYMSEYMKKTGERYPWAYGKDTKAAQTLIKNYGLEGAKAKIVAGLTSKDSFFSNHALSLWGIVSIASRLIQGQIQNITQEGKWEVHKQKKIRLTNGGQSGAAAGN